MRRRAAWRLLQLLLVFAVAVAYGARNGGGARASTSGVVAKADSTAARQDSTVARPDSAAARSDSTTARPGSTAARSDSTAARSDSVTTIPSDSTSIVPADSSGAGTTLKPKGSSVLPDTLQFLPPPGSKAAGETGEGAAKPKEKGSLFGLTPIVILLGIAVLNYFIIRAVTH
jgi:hypothetical protein